MSPDPEGLGLLYEEMQRTTKEVAQQVLQHLSTVHPRQEDLPLGFNDADAISPATSGVVSIADGATEVIVITARDGFTLHLSSAHVGPTDPTLDPGDFPVTIKFAGRTIQRVNRLEHKRPPMLDRKDKLVIEVTNNSGGVANVQYALDGWLRSNVAIL